MLSGLSSFMALMVAFSFAAIIGSFRRQVEQIFSSFIIDVTDWTKKVKEDINQERIELIKTNDVGQDFLGEDKTKVLEDIDEKEKSIIEELDGLEKLTSKRKTTFFFIRLSLTNGFFGLFLLFIIAFLSNEWDSSMMRLVSAVALIQIALTTVATSMDSFLKGIVYKAKENLRRWFFGFFILFSVALSVSIVYIDYFRTFLLSNCPFIHTDMFVMGLVAFSVCSHFISYIFRHLIVIGRNYIQYVPINEKVDEQMKTFLKIRNDILEKENLISKYEDFINKKKSM